MSEGKLFQTRAAATEKERSPMVEWHATGTLSVAVDEDRRRCRAGIPATGQNSAARYGGAVPKIRHFRRKTR